VKNLLLSIASIEAEGLEEGQNLWVWISFFAGESPGRFLESKKSESKKKEA
jgi:hypothetical protein